MTNLDKLREILLETTRTLVLDTWYITREAAEKAHRSADLIVSWITDDCCITPTDEGGIDITSFRKVADRSVIHWVRILPDGTGRASKFENLKRVGTAVIF